MKRFITHSARETKQQGRKLTSKIEDNALLCLFGELGAGKTTFVKGVASGVGIEGPVVSPSFLLLKSYHNNTTLHHIDLFRIESSEEFIEAGLEDYLVGQKGIVAIEWANRIEPLLPESRIDIGLYFAKNGNRKITLDNLS